MRYCRGFTKKNCENNWQIILKKTFLYYPALPTLRSSSFKKKNKRKKKGKVVSKVLNDKICVGEKQFAFRTSSRVN